MNQVALFCMIVLFGLIISAAAVFIGQLAFPTLTTDTERAELVAKCLDQERLAGTWGAEAYNSHLARWCRSE